MYTMADFMYVVKRDGQKQYVEFDQITERINSLCYGLENVVAVKITQKVVQGVFSGITTEELDNLAAETCASASTHFPDYSILASRIAVSNLHKNTKDSFSETMHTLRHHVHPRNGLKTPLIAEDVYNITMNNKEILDAAIDYKRDFDYDFFGFKTLERRFVFSSTLEICD